MTELEPITEIIEPGKWVSKQCPVCDRAHDSQARICTCGFWFDRQQVLQVASDLPNLRREQLKKRAGKGLIVTGFVVTVLSVAAVWTGVIDIPRIFETEKGIRSDNATSDTSRNPAAVANVDFPKNRIEGKVTAISSGDTITVLDSANNERLIRLSGIEAPKGDQEFAEQAKANLSDLVLGKTVTVLMQKLDANDLVGKVLLDGKNINSELVRAGLAWHNKFSILQSDDDRELYADAEAYAKAGKFGLWSNPNAEAPWESRTASADSPTADEKRSFVDKVGKSVTAGGSSEPVAGNTETRALPENPQNISVANSRPDQSAASSPPVGITAPKPEAEKPVAISPVPVGTNKTEGATARCNDQTLSYRVIRTGSCSGHGGVAEWLEVPKSSVKTESNDKQYTLGPRGGCYFINQSGSKVYVDKSRCTQ